MEFFKIRKISPIYNATKKFLDPRGFQTTWKKGKVTDHVPNLKVYKRNIWLEAL